MQASSFEQQRLLQQQFERQIQQQQQLQNSKLIALANQLKMALPSKEAAAKEMPRPQVQLPLLDQPLAQKQKKSVEPKQKKSKKNEKQGKGNNAANAFKNDELYAKRVQRFGDVSAKNWSFTSTGDEWTPSSAVRVVGTSEALEKPYLRLTSAPDPSSVRPERVLKKTLEMLHERWDGTEAAYLYCSEQFRSMRQDLTVQNIKNAFSVEVYETNARIALESSDMFEFNACQTQLWALYKTVENARQNRDEFVAYRILFFVHTKNRAELSAMYADSTFSFGPSIIMHAERVRRAVEDCNWVAFRTLFEEAPLMSGHLMRVMALDFRKRCLVSFCKSFKGATAERVVPVVNFGVDVDKFLEDFVVFDGNNVLDASSTLDRLRAE